MRVTPFHKSIYTEQPALGFFVFELVRKLKNLAY